MFKLVAALLALLFAPECLADLRMASQPYQRRSRKVPYQVLHQSRRRQIPFQAEFALYMEPSDFGYEGLKRQRDGGGYDNFLRSNIDNEQDRRNTLTEDGKDHMPFRSYETAAEDSHESVKNKIPAEFPGPNITAYPGKETLVVLRWNNPHAAELEVNIWIHKTSATTLAVPIVVPVMKPMCSGEGYQDNAFTFKVPADFNSLGTKMPQFSGCKAVGDCVLQLYAHSVESRMYSMGTPLIVEGDVPDATATTTAAIKKVSDASLQDPGMLVAGLRPICLSRAAPDVHFETSQPQEARLISDMWTWAYQDSDYSPYAGQQPERISRNMQASVILKMVGGNRGGIGAHYFWSTNRNGASMARKLRRKGKKLIKEYEKLANSIINMIKNKQQNSDTMGPAFNQQLEEVTQKAGGKIINNRRDITEECFRCKEVGSTTNRRLETNTYIPSFQIEDSMILGAVQMLISDEYKKVMDDKGLVQVYYTAMMDMMECDESDELINTATGCNKNPGFRYAHSKNVCYQGPVMKSTLTTKADQYNYKKQDQMHCTFANKDEEGTTLAVPKETCTARDNGNDNGIMASAVAFKEEGRKPYGTEECVPLPSVAGAADASTMSAMDCSNGADCTVPAQTKDVTNINEAEDMHGLYADSDCDDPDWDTTKECRAYETNEQLFAVPETEAIDEIYEQTAGQQAMVTAGAFRSSISLVMFSVAIMSMLFAAC